MSTTTTNYGLIKPDITDPILIGQLNDNADAIDAALKENADAIENKPDAADIPAPSTTAPAMDGTGSAGTSSQYARADHVHPSDTSKQNALSSTQLAAVNSGINSTKVAQIETNKNNILMQEERNGIKNNFNIYSITPDSSTTISGDDVTFTNTKTIAFTVPKTGKYYLLADIKSVSIAGSALLFVKQGSTNLIGYTFANTGTLNLNFTVSDASNLSIVIIINSATITLGNVMIISEDVYNAGFTDYQPYAMSNAELTAAIQAIQAQLANQ